MKTFFPGNDISIPGNDKLREELPPFTCFFFIMDATLAGTPNESHNGIRS
jgi:hypothetical protein